MKTILKDNNTYAIKLDKGDEIMENIQRFAEDEEIEAGTFTIIGAVNEVELWWYNVHTKKYTKKLIGEDLEITGIIGNIAKHRDEGATLVHMHGTFSDKDFQVYGGHMNRAVVSAACEVFLTRLEDKIEKAYDKEIGLNLMQEQS